MESKLAAAFDALASSTEGFVPRILSQVCRDPLSSHRGCFDRNWWHYKIRDFPSVILQQGGYTLLLAGQTPWWAPRGEALRELAAASCRFWQSRALKAGAFEEYYPWEQGYPPAAFSTLAVAKMVAEGVVPADELRAGATVAARQLLDRFEGQAANQQVAGLAALAWLRRSYPDLVPAARFAALSARTLALQTSEGWFVEYDGPDLGYLSVTLDCLWDLWDATGDDAYRTSARRAVPFLADLVTLAGASAGMHNARNTDYILPYGLLRTAVEEPDVARDALRAFVTLYEDAGSPEHFTRAIDDRYLCHYAGHSLVRGALLRTDVLALAGTMRPAFDAETDVEQGPRFYPESGHLLHRSEGGGRVLVSLRKGGIVSGWRDDAHFADFGWTVGSGGDAIVSHWWSPDWTVSVDDGVGQVTGRLVPYSFKESNPYMHMGLRGASRVFGRKLIGPLKSKLIFQARRSDTGFERSVAVRPDGVEIIDTFIGLPADAEPIRSPRSSKRHVASADSYHLEDLALVTGIERAERRERVGDCLTIVTRYLYSRDR